MSYFLLFANLLTGIAFVIHTWQGDREIRILQPIEETESILKQQEVWTMARCGWHWISFDLLLATILLALINSTDWLAPERIILQIMGFAFLGYGGFWLLTVLVSPPFPNRFLKLGQWILLLVIGTLILLG